MIIMRSAGRMFLSVGLVFALTSCFADEAWDRDEAEGIISGYLNNLEAIESFNLLWRLESEWIGKDNDDICSLISVGRLVLDPSNNRCLSVKHDTRVDFVPVNDELVDRQREAILAVVLDGKNAWHRHVPNAVHRIKPDYDSVLAVTDSPNVYAIGLSGFPVTYQESHVSMYFDRLRQGKMPFTLSGRNSSPQTIIFDRPGGSVVDRLYHSFDIEKLVAKSYRCTRTFKQTGEVIPFVAETYEFQERDGLQLPLKIVGEKRVVKSVGDKRLDGVETYDVGFLWVSVNKQLDDRLFSEQILNDANQLRDLVNPESFFGKLR
jgi:hypothetical protein